MAVLHKEWTLLVVGVLCMSGAIITPALSEKSPTKLEVIEGGPKGARGLLVSTDHISEGKSSRFFGGVPSFGGPQAGFFPGPQGYNMGGFPSYPYMSPYGFLNGPMNYGGFYPGNSGFYGNNFGGYAATQQQQQQQQQQISQSQMGAGGAGVGGFQPFAG